MSTQAVAKKFYELAQEGQWDKIQNELFSKDARSVEPEGAEGMINADGLEAIREKGIQWQNMVEEFHSGYCNEPQVAGNYFTCIMGMDVTMKGQSRMQMDEVALYEVKDGKIVKEQFFY